MPLKINLFLAEKKPDENNVIFSGKKALKIMLFSSVAVENRDFFWLIIHNDQLLLKITQCPSKIA
jgi:hypothetical protein